MVECPRGGPVKGAMMTAVSRLPSYMPCAKRDFIIASACGALLLGLSIDAAKAACTSSERVRAAIAPAIVVDSVAPLRRIEPHFFGFNFLWIEFQASFWNDATGRVEEEAVKWLQAFPGAVYRYPGGAESNYFDWKAAVGPKGQREPRKAVEWNGPLVARFGLDEYLAFVSEVGGQPWYVANLFGEYEKEGDPQKLAGDAGQLAAYLQGKAGSGGRVLRWELGNELDRGWKLWRPEKYLAVSKQVAAAISHADPQAHFVAIMEDYDAHRGWGWRGLSAADYNRQIAAGLKGVTTEYAQHSYYDGVNVEVAESVPRRIAQLCSSIKAAEAVQPGTDPVGIWVTEHTRQPVKKSVKNADWRSNWSQSANLEAALGVADFMIAASQIPEVMGLFVHGLHGLNAPWPMFHKKKAGTQIHPSAVYWALKVLRQGMEAEVLHTTSYSGNAGGYFGGYDFRASVMSNSERTKWAMWAVNRSPSAQTIELRIPALAGKRAKANLQVLGDDNLNANNYLDGNRLRPRDQPEQVLVFDKAGRAALILDPQTITAAKLDVL